MNNLIDTKKEAIVLPFFLSSKTTSQNIFFLKMRLLVCLLLATFQLQANIFAQRVNLKASDKSLESVLKEIRRQTGYSFIYNSNYLKQNNSSISVEIRNEYLSVALDKVFKNQPFDYIIKGKVISIVPLSKQTESLTTTTLREKKIEIQNSITGRVIGADGQPLYRATVRVKGSNIVTSTNEDGVFALEDANRSSVLIISFLGYDNLEISASSNLDRIMLTPSSQEVEEVVVNTGYQTLNAERATGSFGRVDKEQIEKPSVSIAQRLIGTNAGVQANLDVDGKPSFEIRGQSSLYANASPLVVVDGFAIQGDFNSINPNDVESITVLKDAAAASIWGARAANGVIVVVTKNAQKGMGLRVDFQAFTRVGSKFDLDYVNPLASSAETVEYEKMSFNKWSAQENSGALNSNYSKQWSQATVLLSEHFLGYLSESERDAGLERLKTISNKQQIRDLLLANPVSQQYNLSMQGSSGKMNNFLSLMYEKNQSNFQKSFDDKYLINFRNNIQLLDFLRLDVSAMLNISNQDNSGSSLSTITGLSPYDLLTNEDGSLTNIYQYYWPIMERDVPMELFPYADWTHNPIQEMNNRSVTSKQINTRLQGGLSFTPLKGLTYDIKGQYELFNTQNRSHYGEETFYVRSRVNTATDWDRTTNKMTPNLAKGGILLQDRAKYTNWNIRNQISFNRVFEVDHSINAVAGIEITNQISEQFGYPTTYGYNNETLTLGTFPNGPGGTFSPIKNWMGNNQTFGYTNSFSYGTRRYLSYFGNASYTYLNKYTLSGSMRTDASNMITDDPKYRYSPFWSIGGGWNIGREEFLASTDWINRLSVRVTYGYNGNVDPTTAFRPLISTSATPNIYTNDYTASISSFGNPTLRWEKTGTWNLGLDYALFDNKFYGKIDVYNKNGRDLIATLSIPAINGTTSQKLNNAEMTNKGIELEFGTHLKLKESSITWNGALNFSYNKNKITKLFVANYAASNLYPGGTGAYVEGYDANSMWMFEYAGIKDTQPMIKGENGELYDFGAWTPGDGRDFMLNMGTKVAPYTLGFINSFNIYDFNFSFILTGKFGHVFKKMPFNYPTTWGSRVLPNSRLSEVLNGDPSQIVPLPLNDVEDRYYFWDRFYPYLSYLSTNASHIRMQEVYTSYKLPTHKWKGLRSSSATVFIQGNDLFTHVFNNVGEDPEYRLGTMNPRPKYTFGVKVSF